MELWSASGQQGAVWGRYLLKQQPELPFRLAHPLAEAVGSLPHEEGHLPVAAAALVGQRPGHQRLPRPRGAVEKTTSGDRQEDLRQKYNVHPVWFELIWSHIHKQAQLFVVCLSLRH